MVRPVTLTSLPVPTVLFVNAPEAPPVFRVTSSPAATPTSVALPVLSVAVFVPS